MQKQLQIQFNKMCHQKDPVTYLNTLTICHVFEKEEGSARKEEKHFTHTEYLPQSRHCTLSLSQLILAPALEGRYCDHPYFTNEENEER